MFHDFAPKYTEKNLFVTPCRGKVPLLAKWTEIKTLGEYEKDYDQYKNYNIGLLLGKKTGVVALDIDKESALAICPDSPVVKKGIKGETRFFKFNNETSRKNHSLGIELLSTGNQTILPPSLHPSGVAYVWLRGDLLSFDVEDLPTLPPKFLKDYFEIEKKGRHDTLLSQCFAILKKETDLKKVAKELYEYDKEFHTPPWFSDPTEPHKGDVNTALTKFVKSAYQTFKAKGGQVIEIDVAAIVSKMAPEIDYSIFDKKKYEINMPEPTGMLKEVYDCILEASYKPRPKFALASAVQFVGALLSGKLMYRESMTNLYQVLIIESGEGKDLPLNAPKSLFKIANYHAPVGLSNYRSDKHVIRDLPIQRNRLDTIDEISKVFKAIKKDSGPMSSVPEILSELWAHSSKFYEGHKGMDHPIGACFYPCISILGAGTPSGFEKYFTAEQVEQGFGARFMYIRDSSRVLPCRPNSLAPSSSIINFINFWKNVPIDKEIISAEGMNLFEIDLKGQKKPIVEIERPIIPQIYASMAAESMFNEISNTYDNEAQILNKTLRPLKHRCAQQVERVAMIAAISRNPLSRNPFIDVQDVEFARDYVDSTFRMAQTFFGQHLAESYLEGIQKKIFDYIREKGVDGVSRTKLYRKAVGMNINAAKLNSILGDLVDMEIIGRREVPTKSKKVTHYFAVSEF